MEKWYSTQCTYSNSKTFQRVCVYICYLQNYGLHKLNFRNLAYNSEGIQFSSIEMAYLIIYTLELYYFILYITCRYYVNDIIRINYVCKYIKKKKKNTHILIKIH